MSDRAWSWVMPVGSAILLLTLTEQFGWSQVWAVALVTVLAIVGTVLQRRQSS